MSAAPKDGTEANFSAVNEIHYDEGDAKKETRRENEGRGERTYGAQR